MTGNSETLWILKSCRYFETLPAFIRLWNAKDNHCRTLPGQWLERVRYHQQCCDFHSAKNSHYERDRCWTVDIKLVSQAWSYIKISHKKHLEDKAGFSFQWKDKQTAILGLTEMTPNAASFSAYSPFIQSSTIIQLYVWNDDQYGEMALCLWQLEHILFCSPFKPRFIKFIGQHLSHLILSQ